MTQAEDAVRIALGEVGKGYTTHRDCSGFTAWVARQVGATIPEGSVAQFAIGERLYADGFDEPGLLHFWDTFGPRPGHVALGTGEGKVVHALNEDRGIIISDIMANMGGPYMGARRIFASADSPVEETPAPVEDDLDPKVPHRRRRVRRLVHQRGDRH